MFEKFAKEQSIEFAKRRQSANYLVFSTEDAELVGYFAITIKPITINTEPFSNMTKKKLARVSELNEQNHTYNLAAYLIAQLGKPDLIITDCQTQKDMKRLTGACSICLDAYGVDSENKKYDLEIQRENREAYSTLASQEDMDAF